MAAEAAALATGIRRALSSRGVSRHDAEDIAQEAVTRALAHSKPFASVEHLQGWCFLTAWRLVTDRWRHSQRHPQTNVVPDRAVGDGLDRVVQYRAAVDELFDAIDRLSAGQQRALARTLRADFAGMQEFLVAVDRLSPARRRGLEGVLALLAEGDVGGATATDRWARHDLRKRLRQLVHDLPVVAAARLRPLLRPLLRSLRARPSGKIRWLSTAAMVGATAAVSLLLAIEHREPPRPLADVPLAAPRVAVTAAVLSAPEPDERPMAPGQPVAARRDGPLPAVGPPPGARLVNVVKFDDPGGGFGSVDLVPNSPSRPLLCAGAVDQAACLNKPINVRLPPLSPRG